MLAMIGNDSASTTISNQALVAVELVGGLPWQSHLAGVSPETVERASLRAWPVSEYPEHSRDNKQ